MSDVGDTADDTTTGLKHGPESAEQIFRVDQVFKNIGTDDAVEGPGWKWLVERVEICNEDVVQNGTCFSRHCRLPFDSGDAASVESLLQVPAQTARTTAHVEYGMGSRGDKGGDLQSFIGEVSRIGGSCHGCVLRIIPGSTSVVGTKRPGHQTAVPPGCGCVIPAFPFSPDSSPDPPLHGSEP